MRFPIRGMNTIPMNCRALILGTLPIMGALCVSLGAAADRPPAPIPAAKPFQTGEKYGLLTWENMALFNNCWGNHSLEPGDSASSVVRYDPATATCAWRWTWPREPGFDLKGYPSLIVGDKVWCPPGFDASTDPRFPLHLPDMKSLWVRGEMRVAAEGDYDFAFDLAFLEGPRSRPEAMRSEIMIWLATSKGDPAPKEGRYHIDGRAYDLCVDANPVWNPGVPYLAFVLKDGTPPSRLPLHEFIRICVDMGHVAADSYLAAVELGPEIWWGAGEASVRDYAVSLNGD